MECRMIVNDSFKDREGYHFVYFYRYPLVDVIQELLYIQRKETQSINPMLKTYREAFLTKNFEEAPKLFDSNFFKCYKFYL